MTNAHGVNQLSDDELLHRRSELEAMAQGLLISGLSMLERDEAEYHAVRAELQRRRAQSSHRE